MRRLGMLLALVAAFAAGVWVGGWLDLPRVRLTSAQPSESRMEDAIRDSDTKMREVTAQLQARQAEAVAAREAMRDNRALYVSGYARDRVLRQLDAAPIAPDRRAELREALDDAEEHPARLRAVLADIRVALGR